MKMRMRRKGRSDEARGTEIRNACLWMTEHLSFFCFFTFLENEWLRRLDWATIQGGCQQKTNPGYARRSICLAGHTQPEGADSTQAVIKTEKSHH
jgi:hypothetical protein